VNQAAADLPSVRAVQPSPTLAADEGVRRRIAAGDDILHLAFGEAGLPVMPGLSEVLARAGGDNRYGPVVGSAEARAAAAGYFERRGLTTRPEQVIFAPGSKALLFAFLGVLPGDVVLPCPSWVSYAAQAELAGKRVWPVPIGEAGGVPDPGAFEETLAAARRAGGRPGVVVVTLPDNPTGTVAPAEVTSAVAGIAEENGLAIVSDEIYRDLAFEDGFRSPAELAQQQTFVTSGLSKSMALGGWRIGFARLPDSEVGEAAGRAATGIASEIWSSLAAPMQHVAAHVLSEPPEVRQHVESSRRLHCRVSLRAHELLVEAGVECRRPGGAFYLYPDFEPLRPQLASLGAGTADELAELLLVRFGIAVLSGSAFGDAPDGLRFRMATSLLYGRSEDERRRALAAGDPLALPWVASALERLEAALASLAAA
jgi:aspartate aminotransferase